MVELTGTPSPNGLKSVDAAYLVDGGEPSGKEIYPVQGAILPWTSVGDGMGYSHEVRNRGVSRVSDRISISVSA